MVIEGVCTSLYESPRIAVDSIIPRGYVPEWRTVDFLEKHRDLLKFQAFLKAFYSSDDYGRKVASALWDITEGISRSLSEARDAKFARESLSLKREIREIIDDADADVVF
jgi:hypothetical protein